jgi:hypothetical protein
MSVANLTRYVEFLTVYEPEVSVIETPRSRHVQQSIASVSTLCVFLCLCLCVCVCVCELSSVHENREKIKY